MILDSFNDPSCLTTVVIRTDKETSLSMGSMSYSMGMVSETLFPGGIVEQTYLGYYSE